MLENNLKMLQEEFRKQSIQDEPSSIDTNDTQTASYVSFQATTTYCDNTKHVTSDSDDEYDASGKNPFAE